MTAYTIDEAIAKAGGQIMNPATLEALKGSIRKWERIVAGTGEDRGDKNCPLCTRFANSANATLCRRRDGERCPVANVIERPYCADTPYMDWDEALDRRGDSSRKATDDETVMCAVLELEFLKSLLPEGKS